MKFLATGGDGVEKEWYINETFAKNLDIAKPRVIKKNWDYVGIIAGLPGSGKSTLARTAAKYCDPYFNVDKIVFSDKEFVNVTNSIDEYSSVVLDESFASLNTKIGWTPEFLKIINHLQLLRQKHLFIWLCLPNFFDLSKGVAIFRASHLFVTYDENGDRGKFLAFDREAKKKLYVEGAKYMNYSAVRANFIGNFTTNDGIVDEKEYEKRKYAHLQMQNKKIDSRFEKKDIRIKFAYKLHKLEGWDVPKISNLMETNETNVYKMLRDYQNIIKE